MASMNPWRVVEVLLVGLSTFIIGFILTFALSLGWLEWRHPGNNAQGDIGAFVLALPIALLCSVICMAISARLTKSKYSN